MLSHNLLLTGDDGGYNLTKSLRFRSSASAYLNRTPASATNRKTWTISAWVKRGQITGDYPAIFNAGSSAPDVVLRFDGGNDSINATLENGGGSNYGLVTTQVFRDPSAWYHIVWACDTTQATASNRLKLYINGVQVTAFATANYPSLNFDTQVNNTVLHKIGYQRYATGYYDGYMAEINFIDGQQLTPSSFGSTNALTGVWQPARYTGTYGTNGFYLPFTNTTSTSTLGNDFSGNSNTWTVNNISLTAGSTYDSMTDVPTLTDATTANYCVLNPLSALNSTASDGNLKGTLNAASVTTIMQGTLAGGGTSKLYWESTYVSRSANSALTTGGVRSDVFGADPSGTGGFGYYSVGGQVFVNGSTVATYATYTTGDVIGIALDLTNNQVTFYKNGTSQGTVSISSGYSWMPAFANGTSSGNQVVTINCGQQPFSYTPPTGYVALNTFNLPTSTIVKGNTVMDATLYTGNGTSQNVVNTAGFKPDLVWGKNRSNIANHGLVDSVRGISTWLGSNSTAAENTVADSYVTAFNSNGFTAGLGSVFNASGDSYVGWQWQAGQGTNTTNTSGSITSTVSANTTSGFSVVTFTGTGANATVGHGLGVAPSMIIVKRRDAGASGWSVYFTTLPAGYVLSLQSTAAQANSAGRFTTTLPTSSVFSIGTDSDLNASAGTYVAYCWSEIAGFSKFGSYTGNGSTDGPFVYTGFRPKFVMVKASSFSTASTVWNIWDTSRSPSNAALKELYPNSADAEGTDSDGCDILSNGFKPKRSSDYANSNGQTYIYMAFAENPFKNALAR